MVFFGPMKPSVHNYIVRWRQKGELEPWGGFHKPSYTLRQALKLLRTLFEAYKLGVEHKWFYEIHPWVLTRYKNILVFPKKALYNFN